MPWVGSLPCNVRALDSVNSLESLFGTRAILMRMYEEAGKAGKGSQSSCPCAEQRLLGVEAILHAPQWQEGDGLSITVGPCPSLKLQTSGPPEALAAPTAE